MDEILESQIKYLETGTLQETETVTNPPLAKRGVKNKAHGKGR